MCYRNVASVLRPCCALKETENEREREKHVEKMSDSVVGIHLHTPTPFGSTTCRPAQPMQTNNIWDCDRTHRISILMDSQSQSDSDLVKRCASHLEANRGIALPLRCAFTRGITRRKSISLMLMLCVFRISAPSALLFNQFPSAFAAGCGAIL